MYTLDQSVDNGSSHSMRANAFSGEGRVFFGLSRPLFGMLRLGVQGGYARQKSVSFKTESVQGDLYATLTPQKVVKLNDSIGSEDLKLIRSGLFGAVSLALSF